MILFLVLLIIQNPENKESIQNQKTINQLRYKAKINDKKIQLYEKEVIGPKTKRQFDIELNQYIESIQKPHCLKEYEESNNDNNINDNVQKKRNSLYRFGP